MKRFYIKQGTSDKLLLIFSGWASDERLFSRFSGAEQDVCVFSDYRTLECNVKIFQTYKEIEVIAWSLGVFVANCVLLNSGLPVTKALAINGTLYPCDDEKGIPAAIYDGTEKNLTEENLWKFYRRMCRNAKSAEKFRIFTFSFSIPELQEALQNIRVIQESEPQFSGKTIFTEVIIGLSDRIFPPDNQKRAWENFPDVKLVEIAHYDEEIWGNYARE
ncbi:MAG: DUF452 family protein [Prevotellaceae bacterium]|nr:DUF452 family protein [Prevotellaceae bacterium]